MTRVVKGALVAITELTGTDAASCRIPVCRLCSERIPDGCRRHERAGKPLKTIGLVALYDPPRSDAGKLISDLEDLGISVKILTADALPIAQDRPGRWVSPARSRLPRNLRRCRQQIGTGVPDG